MSSRVELGVAQHFIGATDCRFHRATMLPALGLMVSTVGDYRPRGQHMTLGAGKKDWYETMVFRAGPCTDCPDCGGWRVTDYAEKECKRYPTERAAQDGHEAVVGRLLTEAR